MNPAIESVRGIIEKIPLSVLLLAYVAYLGNDYHTFLTDPMSDLNQKKSQVEVEKKEIAKLEASVKAANDFLKALEGRKVALRKLAQELQETRASLTDTLDVPEFMKMILAEARRVSLTVTALKPGDESKKEFYVQQSFDLGFRGAYVQLLAFLDRLANLQKIVRVDQFDMKPGGRIAGKYVELEGKLTLRAFRYQGSKADEIGQAQSANAGAPKARPQDSAPSGAPSGQPATQSPRAGGSSP